MFFIFILAVFLNTVRMDWEKRDSGEESKKWHDFNDRGLGFLHFFGGFMIGYILMVPITAIF